MFAKRSGSKSELNVSLVAAAEEAVVVVVEREAGDSFETCKRSWSCEPHLFGAHMCHNLYLTSRHPFGFVSFRF